jgi:SAM-dependent methyltransferase
VIDSAQQSPEEMSREPDPATLTPVALTCLPHETYREMLFGKRLCDIDPCEPSWRLLSRFVPVDRQARILDAACGSGRFARELARQGYTDVTGFDLFPSIDTGGVFRYLCCSLSRLELPKNSFDFGYCFSAVYHLGEPAEGFRELYRVLRPGAILVMTAHTRYSLFTLDRRLRRQLRRIKHLDGVEFRSAHEYSHIAEQEGFETVELDGFRLIYSPFPVVYSLLNRMSRLVHRDRIPPYVAWPRGRLFRYIRSVFAYHSTMVFRRRS